MMYLVYLLGIAFATILILLSYLFLINKTDKIFNRFILIIMILNILIHLLKPFLWGNDYRIFDYQLITIYNICALIIIISPILYFSKCGLLKDFIIALCIVIAILSLFFTPKSILDSKDIFKIIRYYLCHYIIALTGFLPILTKRHRFNWKSLFLIGILCIAFELIILINNYICEMIKTNNTDINFICERLSITNYSWIMLPPYSWRDGVISKILFLYYPFGRYLPIIWNIIPLYLFATGSSFIIFKINQMSFRNN